MQKGEKPEDKKKEAEKKADDGKPDLSSQQAVAVMGIGLIAMGDDVGREVRRACGGDYVVRHCCRCPCARSAI